MGKKIGIAALICAILYIVFTIIGVTQAPDIDPEVYKTLVKDQELGMEMLQEIEDNASTLYKVSDTLSTIFGWGGLIVAIVSLVKLNKEKEKGKILAVLSIVIILITAFVSFFFVSNAGEAFKAGMEAGMEAAQD